MRLAAACVILAVVGGTAASRGSDGPPKIARFSLGRRGGQLATQENVDLDAIAELITQTEERYHRTRREVQGNKLALRWRSSQSGTADDDVLLSEPGRPGRW